MLALYFWAVAVYGVSAHALWALIVTVPVEYTTLERIVEVLRRKKGGKMSLDSDARLVGNCPTYFLFSLLVIILSYHVMALGGVFVGLGMLLKALAIILAWMSGIITFAMLTMGIIVIIVALIENKKKRS